jgi:hypothetical protein
MAIRESLQDLLNLDEVALLRGNLRIEKRVVSLPESN